MSLIIPLNRCLDFDNISQFIPNVCLTKEYTENTVVLNGRGPRKVCSGEIV